MHDLMIYSLKVGACLAVFYLFFKLLLSRETLHRLNRIVLLAVMVLSFVLPLCVITIYHEVPSLPEMTEFAGTPLEMTATPESFPWDRVVGWVFLLGVVVALGATLCSLGRVICLIRRGRREPLDGGMVLVRTDCPVTPFSWGRYIVLSDQDAAESSREIITHERAHLRLHHSWDILVTDIAGCFQWFNPAMWLLRRELRAIHEYEADRAVLNSGVDAKQYQLLLIKKAAGRRWYSVANSFNHSKLKNRITMMLQKKSSRWAGAKLLLVLPLVGLALGAFAETAYVYSMDKGTKENGISPTPESEIKVIGSRSELKTPEALQTVDAKVAGSRAMVKNEPLRDTLALRLSEKTEGEKQPIWIVDGTEVGETVFRALDLNKIDCETVLKDAEAKRMFPDRDISKVIVVTTKEAATAAAGTVDNEMKLPATSFGATLRYSGSQPEKRSDNLDKRYGKAIVIIDGQRFKYDEIERLRPNEIKSVLIFKGQEAIKRYGPDAIHGAVIIETKSDEEIESTIRKYSAEGKFSAKWIATHNLSIGMRNGHFVCPRADLYLLNGKKSSKAELEALDPETVRSVGGFRGEEAVKKYGEKARGGVVVFKTHR